MMYPVQPALPALNLTSTTINHPHHGATTTQNAALGPFSTHLDRGAPPSTSSRLRSLTMPQGRHPHHLAQPAPTVVAKSLSLPHAFAPKLTVPRGCHPR
eukprot:352662-Chlamydomonas_euryale.AAC.2